MRRRTIAIIFAVMLAGCGKAGPPNAAPDTKAVASSNQQAPQADQIAYTYSFAFKLPGNRLADVQAKHTALCDRLGRACHIVSLAQTGNARDAGATMELAVDARIARPFGDALVSAVERTGGTVTDRTIQGDNLTKQIVDGEARLRGRQALADRLLDVVKTQKGTIGDLVAAQKALADAQQDVDTARAELTGARDHVAMSAIRIAYSEDVGLGGFTAPIGEAFANFGSIAGVSLSALLTLIAALLPWLLLAGLFALIVRWWKRRLDREAE